MTRRTRAVAIGVGVLLLGAFALWARARIAGLDTSTQARNPIVRWEYLFARERTRSEVWTRTRQHLELTVLPVVVGTAISAVLATAALRFRWLQSVVLSFAGALYTIPSLALFGLLATYNTNWTSAIIALTSYTLLIITRNMVTGIEGVPAAAVDAADALGMSRRQRLFKVELPLALPVILTGIRVATVTTVGLVGISHVIQLGGLASYIFDGYRRSFTTLIVLGTVLSILLAVVLDLALRGVERVATPWARRRAT